MPDPGLPGQPATGRIAFQGLAGANSDMACRACFPQMETLPCFSFEEAFAALQEGRADLAMIPIDNSSAGRVADIHHLLPESGLHIIGEHFQAIRHQLLGLPGSKLDGLRRVRSHVMALSQCREYLHERGLEREVVADTAGAAASLPGLADPTLGAIAPALAAEIYGLEILDRDINDQHDNTTRFVIMAAEPLHPPQEDGPVITSFVFRTRSVPASLYKALGGFATNGVNITKLESYIIDGSFSVAQFYADIEGHPDDELVRLALEELSFFSKEVRLLGVYPAHPFRRGEPAV
ncbi:MAG: prephenate dehydratase [Pseudomonadota bacterium]